MMIVNGRWDTIKYLVLLMVVGRRVVHERNTTTHHREEDIYATTSYTLQSIFNTLITITKVVQEVASNYFIS